MALTISTMADNPLVPTDPRLRSWSCLSFLASALDLLGEPWPQDWPVTDRLAVALILERDDMIVQLGHTIEQAADRVRAEVGASSEEFQDIIDDLWALRHARHPSDLDRLR